MKKTLSFLMLLFCLSAYSQEYSYHKAQLHCHSTNSDGNMSPQTVAQEYLSRGYEILFLTDHNYMTPSSDYSQEGLLTFNAEEYTFDKHMNGFFLNHTVDATGFTVQQAIDSIRAQGGLCQFNHPVVAATNDWSYTYSQFMELSNGPDLIEIHNAGTDMIPLATFNRAIWDSILSSNKIIWGTSTDDMHKLTEGLIIPTIDIGWVMIRCNTLSRDSVYAALSRGDFYGTNGVEISHYSVQGNTINISSTNATKIKFIGDNGQLYFEVNGSSATYKRTNQKYIRIELENEGTYGIGAKYAFTQPVFFNSTTDVENNIGFQPNLSIYPNPCTNKLNVCFNTEKESNVLFEIYDLTGKILMSEKHNIPNAGFNDLPFDVSILKPGVYLSEITINGVRIVKKITKV